MAKKPSNIALAYCVEHEHIAEIIGTQLTLRDFIVKFSSVRNDLPDVAFLSDRLAATSDFVVFIVTDNFLKSEKCMFGALDLFQNLAANHQVFTIIADGEYAEKGQEITKVPTSFGRVKDVIDYMNFWQDKYLALRKEKRELQDELQESSVLTPLDERVNVARAITAEINDFLRFVFSLGGPTFEQLVAEQYRPLFDALGVEIITQSDRLNFKQSDENFDKPLDEFPVVELVKSSNPLPIRSASKPLLEQIVSGDAKPLYDKSSMDALFTGSESSFDKYLSEAEPVLPAKSKAEKESIDEKIKDKNKEIVTLEDMEESSVQELIFQFEQMSREQQSQKNEAQNEEIFTSKDVNDTVDNSASAEPSSETDKKYQAAYDSIMTEHNPDKAVFLLQKILKTDKYHTPSLFLLAEVMEVKKNYSEAKTNYEKVAFLDADYPNIYYKLGFLTAFKLRGKKKKAVKYFKNALKRDKKNSDAAYQLAVILYEELGEYKQAAHYFKKTLKINPFHPFANYDLAVMYHELDEKSLAANYYRAAIEINEDLKTAQNDRAFSLYSLDFANQPTALKHTGFVSTENFELKKVDVKTVLITGATSGIGKAVAEIFAKNGHRVIVTGRRTERLEELQKNFSKNYPRAEVKTLNFDVRSAKDSESMVNSLPPEWSKIDILVNNAGLAKGLSFIQEGDLEHWEQMIDTNIKGLLYMTRLVAPKMVAQKNGHIINIGSTAAKEVYPKGNVYSATKFAVDALTKGMRLDLYEHNIRVSQINPGHVEETEFAKVRFDGDEEKAKIYEDFQPLKASDVAESVYFIATRPQRVTIQDVVMTSTQQAGSTYINRSGRED